MSLPLLHAGRTNPGLSAALDLRFALDKSLTAYRGPTPSFSRASTGSYFDGSGVLRYAPVNLVQYSEQFNDAYWTKDNCSISVNSLLAPDGKLTADKVTENSLNNAHYVFRTTSNNSGIYTKSVYMKAGERTWGWVYLESGASALAYFNLENGTIGNVTGTLSPSATITNVGNGWYRCSITANVPTNNFATGFGLTSSNGVLLYLGNGTSGIYIWGAQLETGSTVGTYCPTTSSANSAPRFNHTYNGTSWVSRGLLVEEQRTNQVPNSEAFSNWTAQSGSTVTDASVNGPKGSNTASIINEGNLSVDYKGILQILGNSVAAVYSFSVFAKYNNLRYIAIQVYDGPTGYATSIFDLLNGSNTATTSSGNWSSVLASSTDCGNGWYRLSMQVTSSGAVTIVTAIRPANAGTGFSASYGAPAAYTGTNRTSYIFGAQLEQGSFPTSYIPTTTASVTRSADVCQITGGDFSGIWNNGEGSAAIEFDSMGATPSADCYLFNASTSGSFTTMALWSYLSTTSNNVIHRLRVGGSDVFNTNIGLNYSPNMPAKTAMAFKSGDSGISFNGFTTVQNSSSFTLSGINTFYIGQSPTGSAVLNGHIARLRYYRKRLPNETLQLLSEPDPTLNLQFALNKSLTPVAGPAPSFSRASTGTFFNASGVLTSASVNTPRFDHTYSGGQWVSRGLLLEEQRTNGFLRSNEFSNSATWFTTNNLVSTDSTTSPDGTIAFKVTPTTSSNAEKNIFQLATIANSLNTHSIYVKSGTQNFIQLMFTGGDTNYANFNISSGVTGNKSAGVSSSTISDVGNGWYRISVTLTNSGASGFAIFWINSLTDSRAPSTTSTGSIYLFGAQYEIGAFPTSYIGTTSSPVVRSADVCQITGTSFGWMWNQGEGSVASEFDFLAAPADRVSPRVWYASDGAYTNGMWVQSGASDGFYVYQSGSSQAGLTATALGAGVSTKVSSAYKLNDFAASFNGASASTDTTGNVPTVNRMEIGFMSDISGRIINGHIAKLIYYPARLTNTKLQQLST